MVKSSKEERFGDLPVDLRLLLDEIEEEPAPERLLTLAKELQRALAAHRQRNSPNKADR